MECDTARYTDQFRRDGYFVCNDVISKAEVDYLRGAIGEIPHGEEVRRKRSVYGVRNLLEICPAVRVLAGQPYIRQFVVPLLGHRAFAVRAIYFDKVRDANWSLFWHQDNVISVADRLDVPEFVGWGLKAGVWQVQPPVAILANMVAVRVHLDNCGLSNGPLRVLPGSHRFGWLDDQLEAWKQSVPEAICTVQCGGIVSMSPLIFHASAPSESVDHRRVIHIEYACEELPYGLDWKNRVGPVENLPECQPN